MTVQDSIETDITINAPLEKVWTLVSEPGWWINAGEVVPHEIQRDGDAVIVVDPTHGKFSLEMVESRQPEYVSFRWLSGSVEGEDPLQTLVEFFLDGDQSSTTVRVKESGFLAGDVPEEKRRETYDNNADGWREELAAAKRHLEPAETVGQG